MSKNITFKVKGSCLDFIFIFWALNVLSYLLTVGISLTACSLLFTMLNLFLYSLLNIDPVVWFHTNVFRSHYILTFIVKFCTVIIFAK